jgi:hypothetical protein
MVPAGVGERYTDKLKSRKEEKDVKPAKSGEVVFEHYRFVDPIWRANALGMLLADLDACVRHDDIDKTGDDLLDRLTEAIGDDLFILMSEVSVCGRDPDTGKDRWYLVPAEPFHYSRGIHLEDPEDKDSTKIKNSPWKPAPQGGETVAAVMVDGISFCVIEPCIPPDSYDYKRGREIALGRLIAGLEELGIGLKDPAYLD